MQVLRALAITTLAAGLCLTTTAAGATYPDPTYLVGTDIAHDPSMVVSPTLPRYRVYVTTGHELVSNLRVDFADAGPVMATQRWWSSYNASLWAPDVSYHNGRYWMYYAVSHGQRSAIGLAISPSGLPGTWTDRGSVLTSRPGDSFNAIDPNLLVDRTGAWWLTFGSFWGGLYMTRLDPATGKLRSSHPRLVNVARRPAPGAIEAGFVYQHRGYYYLFASYDYCCRRSRSTYNVRVGVSSSPTGPFVDGQGMAMTRGGGTPVLGSHGWVRGPGGESVVYDPFDRHDLLVYHYYDSRVGGESFLGINYLGWDRTGFPKVSTNPIDAASRPNPARPDAEITKTKIEPSRRDVTFDFSATTGGRADFQCALVRHRKKHGKPRPAFSRCKSPKTYKKLKAGSYTFEVRALSQAGSGRVAKQVFKI